MTISNTDKNLVYMSTYSNYILVAKYAARLCFVVMCNYLK